MKLLVNGLLIVATVVLLAGGVVLIVRSSDSGGVEIVLPTPGPLPAASSQAAEIKVYVTGAVASPGVYAVEAGSRLEHVVEAAGGLTGDADPEAVNLAVRVEDEQHWHVPRTGESARPPSPARGGGLGEDRPEQRNGQRAGDAAGHRDRQGAVDHRLPPGQRPLLQRG